MLEKVFKFYYRTRMTNLKLNIILLNILKTYNIKNNLLDN